MSETVNVPVELGLAGCAEVDGEMVLLLTGGWGTLRGPHVEEVIREVIAISGYIPRYRQYGNKFVKIDDWKGKAEWAEISRS